MTDLEKTLAPNTSPGASSDGKMDGGAMLVRTASIASLREVRVLIAGSLVEGWETQPGGCSSMVDIDDPTLRSPRVGNVSSM